jgi:hypothetical protein
MKIGRLNPTAPIAEKNGGATGIFQRYWDQVCGAIESAVNRGATYAPMTGPSDDTTVYDTTSITLPQLAARQKALEDRLTAIGS